MVLEVMIGVGLFLIVLVFYCLIRIGARADEDIERMMETRMEEKEKEEQDKCVQNNEC